MLAPVSRLKVGHYTDATIGAMRQIESNGFDCVIQAGSKYCYTRSQSPPPNSVN